MLLKKIKKIPFENLGTCMREVKKKSIISPWIEDIFKNKKNIKYSKYQNFEIHKIKLKKIGFKKATKLKHVYKMFKKLNFELVPPELSLYLRLIYSKQPKGEWLRISVPLNSMIDSDGVPHLPKLGRALGKNFIETYWSYPDAIFHPHNDFLVIKFKSKKKKKPNETKF
tara:strand:- start:1587 stop:2093 length:507 start_codon:yes stop_codon:yes gene_type:complete